MFLDRSLKSALANFSTLVLVVALITVPAQLILAVVFRSEIAVQNLAPQISTFPNHLQLHSVGPPQLTEYRLAYWGVTAFEILLLPLFTGAGRRVLEVDAAGGVPTVVDAWSNSLRGAKFASASDAGPLVAGAAIAVAAGLLCRLIGMLLVDPLGADSAYLGVGLVEGVSRALAAPFFLGPWVVSGGAPTS